MNTQLSKVIDNNSMQKIRSEFSRLQEKCYLENAGALLYPQCLIKNITQDLLNNIYMNPHTDKYTRECVEQIRNLVLNYFNTDSNQYSVIFTSGATQSMKLVAESFRFSSSNDKDNGCFIYLRDNHTSVLGLREIAAYKNADIVHISHEEFLNSINEDYVEQKSENNDKGNNLFVYPAQSNFNGLKYPIDCLDDIKNGCLNSHLKKHLCKTNRKWYTLLDIASLVSTSRLDLSKFHPDFACFSFYKMFGYPSGLGALLVRNDAIDVLSEKNYFGGGTVDLVLSSEHYHEKRKDFVERFEDGTVSFLSIIALKHCFDTINKMIPKVLTNYAMDTIYYHTFYLAKDLYDQLKNMRHTNGKNAVVLYMDTDFTDPLTQGAVVTFNLLREDGSFIGYAEFQHMADLFNISVRTGCFCNSGACQRHLRVTNKEMKAMYRAGHKCGDDFDLVDGKPTGAVRASFAYYNTYADVDKLIQMICKCFVKTKCVKLRRNNNLKFIDMIDQSIFNKKETICLLNDSNGNIPNKEIIVKKCSVVDDVIETDARIVLDEIVIFPIKSCGAFKVPNWRIGNKGFLYDREWMIVNENGVCLTQKQNSKMCMIRPTIELKRMLMILNFDGYQPIALPLEPQYENGYREASFCQSKVCSDVVRGYDCGEDIADWISMVLETSFMRLIKQATVEGRSSKKQQNEGKKSLSLSNQAQFLLINRATVRWLKDNIQDHLFVEDIDRLCDRFRGNLIVDTDEHLAEKEWKKIIIGPHVFKFEGLCNRCQMVCIDQKTGVKTVEPLRTISEQFSGKMRFGIYLSYEGTLDKSKDNTIHVKTPVEAIIKEDNR